MTLSTVGSVRFKVYGVLLLVNTVVLALSGHINHFQEFFYKADVFPLALSLVTLLFVLIMVFVDINIKNAFTARPPFELGWLFVFSTLWLAFNAFSSSRWKYASMGLCGTIPGDTQYAPYRTWCHELQALRVFVWIEWVMLLFIFAYLLRWTMNKHKSGRHDVWSTAFSRFSEHSEPQSHYRGGINSEFLQWEKFPSPSQRPQQDQFTQSPQAQLNQSPQGQYNQYLEAQYSQSEYVQPAEAQYNQSEYAQPTEAQYTAQSHAQYMPPSQAAFLHSPQTYEIRAL